MTEAEHIEAFITAFVLPQHRERFRRRPRQFLDAMCHTLPSRLCPRSAFALPEIKTDPQVLGLLGAVSRSSTAVYLGAWEGLEPAEYPLAETVNMVESCGGGVASVEPGEIAFYKTECSPRGDRYLLVRDPARRAGAKLAISTWSSRR